MTVGGCVYCDNRSFSPNRRLPHVDIREQVQRGVRILEKYYGADRFLAKPFRIDELGSMVRGLVSRSE